MSKDEALKMAMRFAEANSTTRISTLGKDDALTGQEVFEACKEALERPSNMVAVPLDKLQDMQRRLKALDKMSENAKELGLDYE